MQQMRCNGVRKQKALEEQRRERSEVWLKGSLGKKKRPEWFRVALDWKIAQRLLSHSDVHFFLPNKIFLWPIQIEVNNQPLRYDSLTIQHTISINAIPLSKTTLHHLSGIDAGLHRLYGFILFAYTLLFRCPCKCFSIKKSTRSYKLLVFFNIVQLLA